MPVLMDALLNGCVDSMGGSCDAMGPNGLMKPFGVLVAPAEFVGLIFPKAGKRLICDAMP